MGSSMLQEFSSHVPEGRHISPPTAAAGAVSAPDPSSGFAQSAPVNAPAPAPPMLGGTGGGTGFGTGASTGAGGHETVHTEFGAIKVAKPALDAAHRAAQLVEE